MISLIILYILLCIKHRPAKITNMCVFCKKKNALIHKFVHFMTVLKEFIHSLVYCPAVNKFILKRKQKAMKRFMKAVAIVAAIWIVLVVINVICNINGHELDSVPSGTMAAVCAMLLDRGLTKKEKNKNDQK